MTPDDTTTPRTNSKWETLCCSGQGWYQIAEQIKLDCRKFETELTTVTEQRDGLRGGIDYASDQLIKVTEQRDRLAEALHHLRTHGDFNQPILRDTVNNIATEALQSLNQPTKTK